MRNDGGSLRLHDRQQQLELVDVSLHDTRPSVPTGFESIDSLLRRGGLLPGTFALLGGRTGTRKSTIVANMAMSMAQAGIPVGMVGLDQPPWQYIVALLSVMTGRSMDYIEQMWDEPEGKELRRDYQHMTTDRIHFFTGRRPGLDHIEAQMEMAAMGQGEAPAVVFIDYLNLMTRAKEYGWKENERIPRLAEDMALWTTETGTTIVALHQLSRNDEYGGTNNRNAGHLPLTLAQLKYGGEEPADIVLGTYRPTMDPLGAMQYDIAKLTLGDRFDEDEYWERRAIVRKYENSTFLQLLKNRPGTHREERGVELLSPYGDSLRMEEKEATEPDYTEEEAREESTR
jgi:hypothetical protein